MAKRDGMAIPYPRARRHSTAGRRGSGEDHYFRWQSYLSEKHHKKERYEDDAHNILVTTSG